MGAGSLGKLVRRLGGLPPASDAALLGRVADAGCPDAFAALVARHGPTVLGVCRRALGDGPDADDAYQAVWLVLLRQAGTVRPRGRVGAWLYGVAVRTARQARSRRRRLAPLPDLPDRRPASDPELVAVIDAELVALPAGMRAAVVLCEIEGRSLREAAADLGVPVGTAASRLARGRQRLADRLRRRGLVVSAAGLSGWLATEATAVVPAGLAAGAATPAAVDISRGVLTMLLFDKLRRAAAGLLLAGGLMVAGGVGLSRATTDPPKQAERAAATGKPDPELVRLWGEMLGQDDTVTVALVKLARRSPAEVVGYLRDELRPVVVTTADAERQLEVVLGDDLPAAAAARRHLYHNHPLLVMSVEAVWAKAKSVRDRQRLAELLLGRVDNHDLLDWTLRRHETDQVRAGGVKVVNYNLLCDWLPDTPDAAVAAVEVPKRNRGGLAIAFEYEVPLLNKRHPGWQRACRAVALLESSATPEAVAVIREVATGHPDARPTQIARRALDRLAKK